MGLEIKIMDKDGEPSWTQQAWSSDNNEVYAFMAYAGIVDLIDTYVPVALNYKKAINVTISENDGIISVSQVADVEVYTLAGALVASKNDVNLLTVNAKGLLIVKATLADGSVASAKISVE
jgi:hypothetical protein